MMIATDNPADDVFAWAREALSIADVWRILGFEAEPKRACKSPFREDKTPSFSIHNDGKWWKDHATGDGGDVIEFIKTAVGGYAEAREWLKERRGEPLPVSRLNTKPARQHEIKWPAELVVGKPSTWIRFAELRGLSLGAVEVMVKAQLLHFATIDGAGCFVVTDRTRRAAEIRRINGTTFGKSKAFPLSGVDKTWLPGAECLKNAPADVSVLITEGATDFLTALDLYVKYRREKAGRRRWVILSILGAACKTISSECAVLVRGRHVRLVPDADEAGDKMAEHWQGVFNKLGCPVDIVTLPRGKDLTDCKSEIQPGELFNV